MGGHTGDPEPKAAARSVSVTPRPRRCGSGPGWDPLDPVSPDPFEKLRRAGPGHPARSGSHGIEAAPNPVIRYAESCRSAP